MQFRNIFANVDVLTSDTMVLEEFARDNKRIVVQT